MTAATQRALVLLVAALGLVTGAVRAEECRWAVEADTGATPAGQLYVDLDTCQMENCGTSAWIYEEANGLPGLQRCDWGIPGHGPPMCCAPVPDRLIF